MIGHLIYLHGTYLEDRQLKIEAHPCTPPPPQSDGMGARGSFVERALFNCAAEARSIGSTRTKEPLAREKGGGEGVFVFLGVHECPNFLGAWIMFFRLFISRPKCVYVRQDIFIPFCYVFSSVTPTSPRVSAPEGSIPPSFFLLFYLSPSVPSAPNRCLVCPSSIL